MKSDSTRKHIVSTTWIISLFLLFSGAAALIYQVVWVRLLSLSIGSTSISISTVLAAFFLGLGTGNYYADFLLKKYNSALKIYLFVELLIAISALVLLPILLHLDSYIASFPMASTHISWRFIIVTLLLLIPTFLIGTTFPLLVALDITKRHHVRSRLAQFYAFNTAGSVLGALLTGIILIPQFGLDGTIYIAALLNTSIFLLGVLLYKHLNRNTFSHHRTATTPMAKNPVNYRALAVLFVTGLSAMATEVGWMKFLIVYTGNTIYGFSLILTMFLLGLALGSWLGTSRIVTRISTEKLLFYGLILLAVMLLAARVGLGLFPEMYAYLSSWNVNSFLYRWSKYFLMFLLLLPATVLLGVLFPTALNYYASHQNNLPSHIGKAYGINIIAGIFGSLLAGFFIIPYFSTDTLLTVIALLVFLSSFVFIKYIQTRKILTLWFGGIFLFILAGYTLPHLNYRSMIDIVVQRNAVIKSSSTTHFIAEGQTGIISTLSYDDKPCIVKILNNGMSESWVDICNTNNLLLNEFLLGEIPVLLNPNAKNAFVVGYGGGTTVRALSLNALNNIDVVELESSVLDAVRSIYGGVLPTQTDQQVHITINDARNTLLMSPKLYDIIVSQPSHPWLCGASNIMNKDFFTIVKSKLSKNGIYAQWVPLFTIDVATLKSIIRAYTDTFEYVISFMDISTKDFLMFGSKRPIVLDFKHITTQMQQPQLQSIFSQHHLSSSEDLMRYFALSRAQLVSLSASAEPATDSNMLAETFYSRFHSIKGNSFNTIDFITHYCSHDITSYLPNRAD